jgi:hypothetical protein
VGDIGVGSLLVVVRRRAPDQRVLGKWLRGRAGDHRAYAGALAAIAAYIIIAIILLVRRHRIEPTAGTHPEPDKPGAERS